MGQRQGKNWRWAAACVLALMTISAPGFADTRFGPGYPGQFESAFLRQPLDCLGCYHCIPL